MKNILTIALFLFIGVSTQAQDLIDFNQYKYIIVDSKFHFLKRVDAYKSSSLTKYWFNRIGFKSYLDNEEIPNELAANKCLGLFATVKKGSGLFVTRTKIELRDCKGKLVYTSITGEGRAKDLKRAYHQSITASFSELKNINHSYDESLQKSKKEPVKEVIAKKKDEVKKEPIMVSKKTTVKKKSSNSFPTLVAQKNGSIYELVDSKTQIVFELLKTNDPEKFIIKDKNGTLVKKGDYWLAEYYDNNELITKKYKVKF
ncbi:hypothetical protein AAON49_10260 [Pseudotenacibaculum sp. MALMAid0570]|uniref:hypothetical protein n=1 Tax=Pseudotenacibaculum sp. MALMAid0570 TaxID=3143938 RepID=UPI0032DF8E7B